MKCYFYSLYKDGNDFEIILDGKIVAGTRMKISHKARDGHTFVVFLALLYKKN